MGFFKNFISQTRKPEGFLGKMMLNSMNMGHSPMALWGSNYLPSTSAASIVDLGCGGGQNVKNLLAKFPAAKVTAIDYSDASVEKTKKLNMVEIRKGRCQVQQGDVSQLNLKDNSFDMATAFETIYFWPGPVKSFKEVFRILKSDSDFLIVNESDGTNPKDQKWLDMIDGMQIYTETEIVNYLKEAGFSSVKVFKKTKKHWISFVAHKE